MYATMRTFFFFEAYFLEQNHKLILGDEKMWKTLPIKSNLLRFTIHISILRGRDERDECGGEFK
jgi:hypothetical protein